MLYISRLILKHRPPPDHGDLQKDGLAQAVQGLAEARA